MAHRSVIPFGPQHPVLPEPLHLDLVIEDDRVIEAIPQIGFVHRGLEKLTEKRDMHQFGYIAERICGICAVGHTVCGTGTCRIKFSGFSRQHAYAHYCLVPKDAAYCQVRISWWICLP